jgi:hypothetical protein
MMLRGIVFFGLLQVGGFGFDALWHGLVHPEFEASTRAEMAAHLATVHLPLYVGVVGFLVAIERAVTWRARRGLVGTPLMIALGGAVLQVIGEAWHAWTHLRLAPEAMVPGLLSLTGFVIALAALGVDWRRSRAQPEIRRRDRPAA